MNRRRYLLAASLAASLTGALLAAGCGSSTSQSATQPGPASPPSLATSLVTPSGTWAVAVLGGSAAGHNNFWQLFVRPTGSGTWRLATPPGVASNGGLVLAGLPAGSVLAGFRPSQDLTYSPLATSADTGRAWSPGLLDAALADVPDALAADPASGQLLALLGDGTADTSGPGGTAWTRLATRQAIADSPAGRRCRPDSLTAAAFSPSGPPMLAAGCSRPGTVGIFSHTGGSWQLTAPPLPAGYAHQPITVLRLTTAGGTTTALFTAGRAPAAHLLAAWSTDGGTHWTLSPALPLNGATLAAASAGPGGSLAVILSGRHAATITSGASSWQAWPVLPAGTATLAAGSAGGWNALAVHRTQLTIWQAAPGARSWASGQVIKVPVQFGSSG
jgi:hypothetical protein